jgi:ABC-2 type transport system ATP-binding protein
MRKIVRQSIFCQEITMIRAKELTKDYGNRRAIDHLSFDAMPGEILGFLGPNGAGKTTTMRVLTGYLPPTEGSAEICGYDVFENSLEVRRVVGYLPETVPLYPEMTISGYLKYIADLRHLPKAEDRVDDVLEMVHLEDRAYGYIGNLSKGMRQRVGLAQALIHQPKVLILDEPTVGLDPAQIIEVRNLIREVGKERTILLSTHILSEAQQVCNRVLIINKGRIVVEDTPEKLQTRLTGTQRVELHVRENADKLIVDLQKIKGVENPILKSDGMIEFGINPTFDARPEVARMVVNSGNDLIEMHTASVNLEEIFLQLTRDEPTAPVLVDSAQSEPAEGKED